MNKILQRDGFYSTNLLSAIKEYVVPEPVAHTSTDSLRNEAERKVFNIINKPKYQDSAHESITKSHKSYDTMVTQLTTDSDKTFEILFSLFEIYLKSDDGLVRKHSMILLGKILNQCDTLNLCISNVQNLVSFCSKHLSDWFFVEGIVQVYLALFEKHKSVLDLGMIDSNMLPYEIAEESNEFFDECLENTKTAKLSKSESLKSVSDEPLANTKEVLVEKTNCVQVILDSILRDVHAPSFSQPIRYMIIKVIEFVLRHYPEYIRRRGGKVITRIFCQMENEKDPRNLMLNFPLIHLILKDYSDLLQDTNGYDETLQPEESEKPNHRLDMIADVLLSYFPIRFKPHHNEIYFVSEEELQEKLTKCFLTNACLASRLLDGCLDVLTDSIATENIVDIRDSLDMFCSCIEHFPELNIAGQYLKLLFDIIKLAAWHNSCCFLSDLGDAFARVADRVLIDCKHSHIVSTTLQPCIKLIFLFYEEYPGTFEYNAAKTLLYKCLRKSVPLFLNVCELLFSEKCLFSNHLRVLYQFETECSTIECVTTNQKPTSFETDGVINFYSKYLDHLKFSREVVVCIFYYVEENKEKLKCLLNGLKETYTVLLNITKGLTTNLLKESPEDSQEFLEGYIELLSYVSTCLCFLMESNDHDNTKNNMIETILMFHAGIIGHFHITNAESWVNDWFHFLDTVRKSSKNDNVLETIINNFITCCTCFPQTVENVLKENITEILESSSPLISSHNDVYYSATLVASILTKNLCVTQPTRIIFLKLLLDNFFNALQNTITLNSPTSATLNRYFFRALGVIIVGIIDTLKSKQIHSSFKEIEKVINSWLLPGSIQCNILNTFFSHLCVLLHSSKLDEMDIIYFQNLVQDLLLLLYLLIHYCQNINLLLNAITSYIPHKPKEWHRYNLSEVFTNSLVLLPTLLFQILYLNSLDKPAIYITGDDFHMILSKLAILCASFVSRDVYSLTTASNKSISCFTKEIILSCYHEVLLLFYFFPSAHRFTPIIQKELEKYPNSSRASQIELATIHGYIGYVQILHSRTRNDDSAAVDCKDFLKRLIHRNREMSLYTDHIFLPTITLLASFCVKLCDDIPLHSKLDKGKVIY
jgi:hypothetical protein